MDVTPDLEHDSLSIFTPTQSIFVKLMSGSSHLDRESIVKIGVECQIWHRKYLTRHVKRKSL